jgi:RNA polymerase sigma-70 factor (ECF subfamily)
VDDDDRERLAARFEEDRPHLRSVAYRMLGSLTAADDAVQEAWLRAGQADIDDVRNLSGWLTTVVTRVCLNLLRTRRTRSEESLDELTERAGDRPYGRPDGRLDVRSDGRSDGRLGGRLGGHGGREPEQEALMADSVGVALLVVLDTLAPVDRVAFVLHDMFAKPLDEIAEILERSPASTRQLASRARRRVQGRTPRPVHGDLARRRRVVDAFLSAARGGDLDALVAVLDPSVVLHADRRVGPTPEPVVVRGATNVAAGAVVAMARARYSGLALIDGTVGLVMAPQGRLRLVLRFEIGAEVADADAGDRITGIEIIAERERLEGIVIEPLEAPTA